MIVTMRNTVGKLQREFLNRLTEKDYEMIELFSSNPKYFLDLSGELALELKFLQE
jgi:hypothetical protein